MKTILRGLLVLCICACFSNGISAQESQVLSGEPLSEVPLWPVPSEMTLEEYEDANRRLTVGMMLMTVPIPGALQFYANEPRSGWKHLGVATIGLMSIALGAASMEDGNEWEKSDYEVMDIVGKSGKTKRYEKIPVKLEGEIKNYKLREISRKQDGAGGLFVVLGVGAVAGSIINGWIDGIKTIERKRNAVRYRYGKQLDLSFQFEPKIDVCQDKVGAQLSLRF